MKWTVRFSKSARKALKKIDRPIVKRILFFLKNRVEEASDPRNIGYPLKGSLFGELWKYRVGDYRIICKIDDENIEVLVVRIGHRREVYRST